MRILITGSEGFIGSCFLKLAADKHDCIPVSHSALDITKPELIQSVLAAHAPDVVVNCAALAKVKLCAKNPMDAFRVNALGPMLLASECKRRNILFCHISTNYAFNDSNMFPNPLNLYGMSKLCGEWAVQATSLEYPSLIIRTANVFGLQPNGTLSEPLESIRRKQSPLRVISDQVVSVTFVEDFVFAVVSMLENQEVERTLTYNVINSGCCTWLEFAKEAARLLDTNIILEGIPLGRFFKDKIERPMECYLQPTIFMRSWQEALAECLSRKVG